MRIATIWLASLALTACSEGDPAEADTDYAAINDSARAPAEAITPDVIRFEDIEKHELFGAGCNVLSPDGEGLLLTADESAAHFLLDGNLISLAPHPGSDDLPYGIFSHYDGLAHAVALEIDVQSKTRQAPELTIYNGRMTIHDERDRIVFAYDGKVECGA